MKNTFAKEGRGQGKSAFTLVELLTVIAIIGILAAMLLVVLPKVKSNALKTQARIEATAIATAIQAYDSAYGRFPVSSGVQSAARSGDFTFGGAVFANAIAAGTLPASDSVYTTNNSEVIAILMDFTNYPSQYTTPPFAATANANHQKNSQKTAFLIAKLSSWEPAQGGTPLPGVGSDLVYRDPWGNPYIISMDLNYDGQCQDAFYGLESVSQNPPGAYVQSGYNGLNNPNSNPASQAQKDSFRFHGTVMVWSAGPDGKITSIASANSDVNKDNILTWQN
ncbi:MAG: type II secretion system protein [Verrucomicrobiota bacterium]|jgi:prepilin-type N-terminal cleavage/methylation domain-containing protein